MFSEEAQRVSIRFGQQWFVTYHDPYIQSIDLHGSPRHSQDLEQAAQDADCVVIATNHSNIDYAALLRRSRLVVDTRNALRGIESSKIRRL